MTAQQTAAKERFEVICRAAGAEKERKRIRRAIAPVLRLLRRHMDDTALLDRIDEATRRTKR